MGLAHPHALNACVANSLNALCSRRVTSRNLRNLEAVELKMGNLRISEWRKLPVSLAELCLDTTLRCGQSFRWRKLENGEWTCALHGRILSLKQDQDCVHYRATWPTYHSQTITSDDTESLLRHYFNLSVNLTKMYDQWSKADSNFKKRAPKFTGVRILKQDAWEALVGFICSSNNNIVRISQMVNNLCINYGPLIGRIESQAFYDFPSPDALVGLGVESRLRELGFGYRAKYIAQTARMVAEERSKDWLIKLSNPETSDPNSAALGIEVSGRLGYREAHEQLLDLQGVGPKVADCVCLMGLGWGEAVPVDTHVWQIAQRDYKFGRGKHKSLTKATYDAVGDHFRGLWGTEAGWAHSVLFAADLKTFSERLTTKIEVDTTEIKSKQESNSFIENTKSVKREYQLEEVVKTELEEGKVSIVLAESPRELRAKKRRITK